MDASMDADVDALIDALTRGREGALDQLVTVLYQDLKHVARGQLRREVARPMQTTALVHEAWLKLSGQDRARWNDRGHFLAVAALAMRRILFSVARSRLRAKRGSGEVAQPLDDVQVGREGFADDIVALSAALDKLDAVSERGRRVFECRTFLGLTIDETAEALQVSPMTVKRDWRHARAWVLRELGAAA